MAALWLLYDLSANYLTLLTLLTLHHLHLVQQLPFLQTLLKLVKAVRLYLGGPQPMLLVVPVPVLASVVHVPSMALV